MKLSARRALLVGGVILFAVLVLKGSSLLVPSGNWAPEGTMATARLGASAALLADGRILITGGDPGAGAVTTADFFNTDGTISSAPAMSNARSHHISMTLKDGRILAAGGITAGGSTTSTVEIFDPITNSWTSMGVGMVEARSGATATLLSDGRVLIAGGQNGSTISSTIEVFDPALGAFTSAGMMSSPRTQHGMAALQDGRVLIVGGFNGSIPVASTDIFDPVAGMVSAGPNLSVARLGHSATTLLNGQVVVIGGNNGNANPAQMDATPAEMVDFTAATPAFTTLATNLAIPREGHLALLLPNNNNILIVGGTSTGTPIASAELFTPQESPQGVWTYGFGATGALTTARSGLVGSANQLNVPSSTMQRNGVVMVAGGNDASGNALNTTEAYGYPTVQTDQSDYPPGTTVTITGRGFQPNEVISIQLVESPLIDTHGPYMVQADTNGNFVDTSFMTDVHDVDIRFYLSATGGTSGFVAQDTFTDASPVLSVTVVGPSGSGSVSSADGQITNCTAAASPGHTCSHTYGANFSTTLTETPNSGFTFIGWSGSGGCTGTSTTCAASANGNNTFSATATFAANQAPAITSANNTTFTAGTAGSFTVTASGVPAPTFTETGTLPSGVTLSSAGILSGTATVAGSFPITITASNGVLPNATQSFMLTVNPGAVSAGTSTVSANPTSVVADGSTTSTITVTLKDANNNPVSGKTVTLSAGSGSSTISAVSGASNASGVVTFTVKDAKAETVTYTAKDSTDNVTITQTASVTFTPGPVSATRSTVTANPTSVTADGSTTSTITVTLLDANSNPVSGKTVTLSQGAGSSTISAASGASNANGIVTFTVKDTKAEAVTYTATDSTDSTTITQTASVTFTAGAVNAAKSTVSANPTSVTADGSTTSTNTVTLLDANNNPVSAKTVTLSQGAGSSTISAASGPSNAGGVVTFTVKDTKAETVTYTAKDGTDNITITQTAAVTFTPGAAAKLAFTQQPTNTAAGSSITPAVTVQVQDANGNAVISGTGSTASIAMAIGTNPSGGALGGTLAQTAVNGVATFSNLSINKTGAGYTLAASSSGLAAGTSNTFNVTPGTATQLVFGTQPSNTTAGTSITPAITVQVEDANNNIVTTSTAAVAMAIGTNPAGGTLSGTTNVNAVNGIATFSNLSINKTGTGYGLATSSTGLTGATSNAFNISPGAASKLAFSQQPTNTQAGSSITPAVTVQVEDANNNLVTTSTASIVVAVGTNAGGGTLSGTLTQSAVNGVATFANLSINKTGTGYTLAASSTGLAGTVSNGFNITAGAASKLAFNVQPSTTTAGQAISPAVTVQVQDANGNVVTTDASSISITISSPGAFSGSSTATVSASSGVATFSNLVPTVAGTFTLSASDGLLTSATSNSFTVNAGALAKFVIATISSPQTAGVAFNVTVTAQDANGNTVANYNGDGNKANLTSTGALVGSPITTASFTNGMVVQSVTITNTGNFTITAVGTGQGNGIGGVPSNLFTVNAGPAASLTVSASASATAGTAFNFTVTAKDSLGNVATGYAGAVRFSSTDAQAVLPANSALTNGTGTFSATLKTAGTRTITATDTVTSSIAGVSGNITVSAGPATALVVSAPTSATAGTAFNFTVTAKDAFSNVATGYAGMVKFSSTDAQAVLPANSALTNGTGTFSATLKTAGTQIITATDTVTSSVTGSSGNITVSAGSAAAISAFSGSGQNTTVGMAFANPLVALVQDGFGNPVSGVAVTFAAPSSGPSGTFNNNTTNIVAETDATGHAGTTFTANTVAGVYAVTASTSGVATSASFSLANLAGAITHLALTPATATITAGGNQVYMAEGLDTYNNPAGDVTSATIFIIAPDGSCGTPNPGNSTCTATAADMNGSSHTVTGTYMNSATGSASLTVNAASPTQLVMTSSAFAIIAGQCSGNMTVTSQDQYGNASNVSSATQVNLSSASATGKFYSESSCQTQIPVSNGKISVNMAANSSTQTFAYEDTTPSPLPDSTTTITAADDATILTSGSQAETILQLVFTTSSFTVTQNACSAQITLSAKNAKGTATNVTVAATLGLTSTSNGATFYSDNTCAMAITATGAPLASDVTLGSGASVVSFSYEDSAAGNPTITATIGGYSVAQQEQIGTPPSVTANPSGQAVTYGSNAMFTAAASGTPTPTVQWQVYTSGNWSNLSDGGFYSGATTTTLTLTAPPVSLSGTQYQAVFTNPAGTATSKAATLTVNQATSSVTVTCPAMAQTYTGSAQTPCTASYSTSDGLSGSPTVTYTNNVNAGMAGASASYAGDANHAGSSNTVNFTICKANSTTVVIGGSFTYDGNPHAATVSVTGAGGLSLTPAPSYSGSCIAAPPITVAQGTSCLASYTYTGDVNHTDSSSSAAVTITAATPGLPSTQTGTSTYGTSVTLTVKITATGSGETPTGSVQFQFSNGGVTYNICSDGSLQAQQPSPGTPCVVPLDNTGTATVTTTKLPAGMTADAIAATYIPGDSNYTGGMTSINYTVSMASTLATLKITPATAPTYGDTVTLSSTVSDSTTDSTGTPTGTVQFEYSTDGGSTWINIGDAVTLSVALDGTDNAQTTTTKLPAGTPQVKAVYSGDTNFTGSSSGATVYPVNQKALTVTGITASNRPYDGLTDATLNTASEALVGAVNSDSVTLSGTATGAFTPDGNVGNNKTVQISGLTLTGAAAANYTVTQPTTTANITPVQLTVTAPSPTVTYGDPVPILTPQIIGFVHGEDSGVLTTQPTCTTTYTPSSNAGSSPTTSCSGAVATNYTFTYTPGTVTVNQAPSTTVVTFEAAPYTYRATAFTATAVVTGVGGLNQAVAVVYSGDCTNVTSANGCTATATFAGDTNHTTSMDHKSITINQAPSTTVVTFEAAPYTYRGTAFTATAVVTGVGGLNQAVAVVYSGDCTNVTSANGCTATATFAGDTNHTTSMDHKSITINQAPSTTVVTFEAAPYTYRATAFTATAVVTGVGGLNQAVAVVYSGDCTNVTSANGCTATATFAGDTNHTTSMDHKSITINQAPSTTVVTFEAAPYTYRATAFTATAVVTGVGGLNQAVAVVYSGDCTNVTSANGCTATATFAGDTNHTTSIDHKSITITQAPSTTMVACPMSVTYSGSPQTPCTAAVTGAGLSITPAVMYSGDCTNVTAAGCTAAASYPGDTNHTPSLGSTAFTISPVATSTTVSSSPNPSNWGNVVTITATVTNTSTPPTPPVPTGSVSFYKAASGAGCSSLGSSTLLDTEPLVTVIMGLNSSQQASTSTPNLPVGPGNTVGSDSILACYNYNPADQYFNANFVASNGTTTQTVNPAPIATLVPSSLSFGGQQGGTVSGAQTVTICNGPSGAAGSSCLNAPVSTAALVITGIGFTSPNTNPVYFNQTSTCPIGGTGVPVGGSCASNVKFAPPLNAQGIATALLTVTDNNENVAGSAQSASLVGAGTSAVTGVGSLSTYAIFGTANGCSSVNVSGNGTVDSFGNSNSSGNVGTNGNVTLSGNPVVNGAVYSPISGTGNCSTKTMTGLSTSGKAQATGGLKALSGSVNYPLPPSPNPAPPTTSQNISGSCGSISGCSNNGSKNVTLASGQYGNLSISGGTTVNVSGGSYNINSLTLSGNSTLVVAPNTGPVVVNLAGKSLSGGNAALDLSGGSMSNPSGMASNLQFYYAGSQPMKLSGGTGSYAVVYAPNAPINVSGGSHFYGSIIGSTVNSSGNTAIHYPTSLPSIGSGSIWFSSTGLTVKGLPNSGTVKLYVTNASINFMASGTTYNLPVPNAVITFSSTATSASTTWDATNNRWSTLVPMSSVNGNATIHSFFDGVAMQVPAGGFPTGIQNVTWQAAYSTSTTGLSFNWQWGAAVYSTLPAAGATGNYSSFGVNSLDNSVPAGTPVNYEGNLIFGDTGAGYTGLYANFVGVVPTIAPMNIAPSSYDFGGVSQGSTATANVPFILTNNDSVPYTISNIQITGTYTSDFVQTNNCPISPNTLGAGASCMFTVTFTPSTSGGTKETAKIVVNDNANNSPQTVFLKGAGQ